MKATPRQFLRTARGLGPYVLMELLLPGGTLIAILFWLSQGLGRTGLLTVDQTVVAPFAVEQVIAPAAVTGVAAGASK